MTPGREYPNFRPMFLTAGAKVPFEPKFYIGRGNHWTRVDFDGDRVLDLVIGVGDWREYGWDNAFDSQGRWTHGPLARLRVRGAQRRRATHGRGLASRCSCWPAARRSTCTDAPTPQFADWDRDGDLDLVCGEFLDRLTYFENVGTLHQAELRGGPVPRVAAPGDPSRPGDDRAYGL